MTEWIHLLCLIYIFELIILSLCERSPTKASLYGAILFTLQEAHWLPLAKSTLILAFTLFMVTSKVRPRVTLGH